MLVKDHHAVSELFERFERGFRTDAQKAGVIEKVCDELTVHARIEEKHLYPAARRVDRGLVGHAIEEHKKVKDIIARLRGLDADDAETDELMSELISDVRDHVEEEEDDLFPKLRDALGREALLEIGTAMMQAKRGEKRRMKAA